MGKMPSYLENRKKLEEFTSDWKLVEKDNECGVELWEFKDEVTWREERCIKCDGRILMSFHDYDEPSKMRVASRISLRAVANALSGGYVLYLP